MEKKCDNKEGNLNRAHPYPRVLGYKRRNDIYGGVSVISYILTNSERDNFEASSHLVLPIVTVRLNTIHSEDL
jgi:hypothetical protein